MLLSMPSKRPDVTVCVIGSSLRHVIVVPTFTVVVDGWNISELMLITGPADTDGVLMGAALIEGGVDVSAWALQPARALTVMNAEAVPMISLRRTD